MNLADQRKAFLEELDALLKTADALEVGERRPEASELTEALDALLQHAASAALEAQDFEVSTPGDTARIGSNRGRARMARLKRRMKHLDGRVDGRDPVDCSYDLAERSALQWALEKLQELEAFDGRKVRALVVTDTKEGTAWPELLQRCGMDVTEARPAQALHGGFDLVILPVTVRMGWPIWVQTALATRLNPGGQVLEPIDCSTWNTPGA